MNNVLSDKIFDIKNESDFNELALKIFRFQSKENQVYRDFLSLMGYADFSPTSHAEIPFLPVEFFKTHQVYCGNKEPEIVFSSSGTTGAVTSKHYVQDKSLYVRSFTKAFKHFYGDPQEFCILALLPSYLERSGSSLIFMMEELIRLSGDGNSGFYLQELNALAQQLEENENKGRKTLLIGVSYALLDLLNHEQIKLKNTIIMETGGMKGKRPEMIREELHSILCRGFGVNNIHSEYGMTELLSQSYSKKGGIYFSPPWKKILIRDTNDPFTLLPEGRNGGINVIDLANIHSCSFIATQDLGKSYASGGFEVSGRFDNSDLRGCNLMV